MKRTLVALALLLTLVGVWGCGSKGSVGTTSTSVSVSALTSTPSPGAGSVQIGRRTKTTGCKVNGPLPDSACTPGAIFPNATKEQVCTPGYSKSVRNVPARVKNQVYAEYGITSHKPGQYEVDHLISLELGGSNSIANLWPEAAEPRPGFHEKDKVENYLHAQVCDGTMSLQQAQQQIATNWLEVYKSMPGAQE